MVADAHARSQPAPVTLLWIGLGGFAGAITRYLVDTEVAARLGAAFPYGTLIVNLSGSFALGVLVGLIVDRQVLPAELRVPLGIGFLGAYTTFSTWMLESWRLLEAGAVGAAVANLVVPVVLGLIALAAGAALGRLA